MKRGAYQNAGARPRQLRTLILGLTVALLGAVGCESTTGLDCDPETTLDCGRPLYRGFELTVEVTSEDGAALPGASVRFEAPRGCCEGTFWVHTTDSLGRATIGFLYVAEWPLSPQVFDIFVTPPAGSPWSPAAASDTVVFLNKRDTRRLVPIALTPIAAAR